MLAFGIRSASQRECATGENTSSWPCHTRTGTFMSAGSNPHGEQKASESSIQPSAESRSASAKFCTSSSRRQASPNMRWSDSGSPGPRWVTWLAGLTFVSAAIRTRTAVSSSGSVDACLNSSALESDIPANQSRPSAHEDSGSRHPVGEQGRAGQRVRAAARPAEHSELVDFECVGYRLDIRDDIGHLPKLLPVRFPVARPVEGDQPHAEAVQDHRTREGANSATRCPVHQENGVAERAARHLNCHSAAIRRAHPERHARRSLLAALRMASSITKRYMEQSQLAPMVVAK
jgi:hypothetical protein